MSGSTTDPEERERLERFLQWRQSTGRARPRRRPTTPYLAVAAIALLDGIAVAAWLWTATDSGPRQRAAVTLPVPPAPAERVAADSSEHPAPLAPPPAPPRQIVSRPVVRPLPPRATAGGRPPRTAAPSPAPSPDVADARPPLPPARPEHVTSSSAPPPETVRTPEAPAPFRPVHVVAPTDSASRPVAPVPTPSPEPPSGLSEHVETLKRLAGYLPEVRLARAIAAWVKTQPPADGEPLPELPSPQAR